jgi:hypothetical protein
MTDTKGNEAIMANSSNAPGGVELLYSWIFQKSGNESKNYYNPPFIKGIT